MVSNLSLKLPVVVIKLFNLGLLCMDFILLLIQAIQEHPALFHPLKELKLLLLHAGLQLLDPGRTLMEFKVVPLHAALQLIDLDQ